MSLVQVPHAILYWDHVLADADGLGWCVDLEPGSTSYRFATVDQAAAFVQRHDDFFVRAARASRSE